MTQQHIEVIPINEIRIANPRTRSRATFRNIVTNIGNVGLKKPITVARREPDDDGSKYDLVCGQGRIEAFLALGENAIPAIVIDASPEERYLMSLVENIARRRPATSELVHEVRSLIDRGYRNASIARKLGMAKSYIHGVATLLRRGEDKLISQVEAGVLPINVAVEIASASSKEVQKALSEAYESGSLRGGKFRAVQSIVARRFAKAQAGTEKAKKLSGADIVREYERQTVLHRNMLRRAALVAQRLALITSAMKRLLKDEHFVTLLRAESLHHMPELLAKRVG